MFIVDATLKTALQNTLQKSTLPAFWDEIVTSANSSAYWDIVGRLVARGFTKAQVDSWDRGAEFQRSIGLFWCLNHPAAIGSDNSYSRQNVEAFDRRLELSGDPAQGIQAVAVTSGGVLLQPEGTAGQPTVGPFDTSTDLFLTADPEDSRIGRPSEL